LRLTCIKIARDPLRLFSFNAKMIKLIARALEDEQAVTELFELGQKFLLDRKRIRRELPILFRKKTLLRERAADDVDLVVLNLHQAENVQRPTSNVQY